MSDFTQDFRTLSGMVEPVEVKITVKKDPAKPYVGLESMPSRGAHLLGWEPASSSISTNSVFSRGDVLFGKLRPNLRKCVTAPFDGYCSTDILVLRAKDGVDSGFAGKVFQTEQVGSAAERTAIGTKMPRTSWRHLKEVSVFCPELKEQKLTAQILDTLDTAIRETEALVDKLKAVKQGLLHDLLTRGIDANGQLRPPQSEAPQLYKASPLGWIPREWGLRPLGHILSEPTKNGLYKPSQFHGRGPLMVQMGGLFAGETASFDTATRVQVTPSELNTFGLSEGDLLFARRSLVFEGAGQCVIVRHLSEPATFESSIVRVRVRQDEAHPEFVCQFLRGHRSYAQRRTLIRQVAVSGVSGSDIRELLIALPSLEEQDWIVGRQLEVQTRIDLEMASAAKLRSQKAGLMDDLLTGRVRVTPLLESVQQPAAQTGA